MSRDIIAEIVSSEDVPEGKRVVVRVEKISPVPSEMMVRERARARAMVEAGIADTVSDIFTRGFGIERFTTLESAETISTDWPEKKRYTITVKQ